MDSLLRGPAGHWHEDHYELLNFPAFVLQIRATTSPTQTDSSHVETFDAVSCVVSAEPSAKLLQLGCKFTDLDCTNYTPSA